jgi:hypothetical protein
MIYTVVEVALFTFTNWNRWSYFFEEQRGIIRSIIDTSPCGMTGLFSVPAPPFRLAAFGGVFL